jgi:hypothetical protein
MFCNSNDAVSNMIVQESEPYEKAAGNCSAEIELLFGKRLKQESHCA